MNLGDSSIGHPHGRSVGLIVALAIAAILAWFVGGTLLSGLLVLVLFGYVLMRPSGKHASGATSNARAGTGSDLGNRVELLERRVAELQRTVDALRGRPAAPPERAAAPQPPPPPPRPPERAPVPPRVIREPEPAPAQPPRAF